MRRPTLGTLLASLERETEAIAALEAVGDLALFAQTRQMAEAYAETPGAYVAGAARRFSAASDEEWLALMTAAEKSEAPGLAAIERMTRWALAQDSVQDEAPGAAQACGCGHGPPPRG